MDAKLVAVHVLAVVHALFWSFVLFAWTNPTWARLNVFYVIPVLYILHLLPFHVIQHTERGLMDGSEQKRKRVQDDVWKLAAPHLYFTEGWVAGMNKHCFQSPVSVQGVMLFSLMSSIFALYPEQKNLLSPFVDLFRGGRRS